MARVSEDQLSDRKASHAEGQASAGYGLARHLLALVRSAWSRFRSFLVRGRFSSLTRRIVVFNVVALIVMVAGILYINQFREGLIDARRQSLLTQAEIIAGAIAQGATEAPQAKVIDPLGSATISSQWSSRMRHSGLLSGQ